MANDVNRQAGEVEITADVLEAGVEALMSTNTRYDSPEAVVAKVYLAMRARCGNLCYSPVETESCDDARDAFLDSLKKRTAK